MKKLLLTLLAVIIILTLAACDKGGASNLSKKAPTEKQWADVGISGTFNAEVKGELALSVVENGEITMKWTGSDEASLDNTITWLKGQGFTSYNGSSATKEQLEGGNIISYTAEKTVETTASAGATQNQDAAMIPLSFSFFSGTEEKNMVAETYYITADFSMMGQSFKAGDLYLDIYESENIFGSSLLTAWPDKQIRNAIGESIPTYAGTASGYQFTDSSVGSFKNTQITVYGTSEADATAYKALLSQSGFAEEDETYSKILQNGNQVQIMVYASQSYHPETFQIVDVINITVTLEKNSGAYASWNALNLSAFSGSGLPAYIGGTSFDIDDIGASTISLQTDAIRQALAALEIAEAFLTPEEKAELEEYRKILELSSEIEAFAVTVYGTSSDEADAYEDALREAGFISGLKNYSKYQIEVSVNEEDGKTMITLVRMPIELASEIPEDDDSENNRSEDPSQGGADEATLPSVDWDDLPTNVKITYKRTVDDTVFGNYTFIKIGNDWFITDATESFKSFLKYTDGGWVEYYEYGGEWLEVDTYSKISSNDYIEMLAFMFSNNIYGYTKGSSEEVAGMNCDVYNKIDDSLASADFITETVKKILPSGAVLYHAEITTYGGTAYTSTQQITLWDTSVTSFGDLQLP